MKSDVVFFSSEWLPLLRIVVVGALAYFSLLLILRTTGPRSVGKTNLFDFIVSVAVGGVFARVLTEKSLSLAEAVTAFLTLVALQYIVSLLRTHSKKMKLLLDSAPTLLFYRGEFLEGTMKKSRLTESDTHEAIRLRGLGSMSQVEAIILEGNGDLSVIEKKDKPTDLVEHAARAGNNAGFGVGDT